MNNGKWMVVPQFRYVHALLLLALLWLGACPLRCWNLRHDKVGHHAISLWTMLVGTCIACSFGPLFLDIVGFWCLHSYVSHPTKHTRTTRLDHMSAGTCIESTNFGVCYLYICTFITHSTFSIITDFSTTQDLHTFYITILYMSNNCFQFVTGSNIHWTFYFSLLASHLATCTCFWSGT